MYTHPPPSQPLGGTLVDPNWRTTYYCAPLTTPLILCTPSPGSYMGVPHAAFEVRSTYGSEHNLIRVSLCSGA
jgi:hypothetical protein